MGRMRERIGKWMVVGGGVVTGTLLVLPGFSYLYCFANGEERCQANGLALLVVAGGFMLLVVWTIVLMIRGERLWLIVGGLAAILVALNSLLDLLFVRGMDQAQLINSVGVLVGGLVLAAGAAVRLAARRRPAG